LSVAHSANLRFYTQGFTFVSMQDFSHMETRGRTPTDPSKRESNVCVSGFAFLASGKVRRRRELKLTVLPSRRLKKIKRCLPQAPYRAHHLSGCAPCTACSITFHYYNAKAEKDKSTFIILRGGRQAKQRMCTGQPGSAHM
jgi:hypothetical protein